MEQGLRIILGLATPEDSEPVVSAQSPSQVSSNGPENLAPGAEPTCPSRLVPDPAASVLNRPNTPAQSSNDMQVDQTKVPFVTIPPRIRHRSKRILQCQTQRLPRSSSARDRPRYLNLLSLLEI